MDKSSLSVMVGDSHVKLFYSDERTHLLLFSPIVWITQTGPHPPTQKHTHNPPTPTREHTPTPSLLVHHPFRENTDGEISIIQLNLRFYFGLKEPHSDIRNDSRFFTITRKNHVEWKVLTEILSATNLRMTKLTSIFKLLIFS